MKYLLLLALCLLPACRFAELAPDTMQIGAIHHMAEADVYSPVDRSTHGEADGQSFGISFGWNLGHRLARADADYEREERLWSGVMDKFAEELSRNRAETIKPDISVNVNTPPVSEERLDDAVEDEVDAALGILQWYGEANLFVQIIIAVLILGVIVSSFFIRKSLVVAIRYLAFWRWGKDFDPKKPPGSN